jgi:chromosome partitioning protein
MPHPTSFICVWLLKGGVAKTTTTFALATALVQEQHKRVLLIDADGQRSLTQHCLSSRIHQSDLTPTAFLQSLVRPRTNFITLSDSLENVRQGGPILPLDTVRIAQSANGGQLFLAPGHPDIALFDGYLHSAEDLSVHQPALINLVGAAAHTIRKAAQAVSADVVLIDLSPNAGVLNRTLVMTSDYLLLTCIPDSFSEEAVNSIESKLIHGWIPRVATIWPRTSGSLYPLDCKRRPKLLGCIISRYHVTRIGEMNHDNNLVEDSMARNVDVSLPLSFSFVYLLHTF